VPLSPVPTLLKKLAVDLALEQLFVARGFSADSSDQAIAKAAETARKTLELIAKGVVALGVEQPKRDQAAQVVAPDRVFDREKMEGF
jgi:phage gp36-like protein